MDERCQLVIDHRDKYGVTACCEAMGVSRSSVAWRERERDTSADDALRDVIRGIIKDHPGYGWRRIQPELEARVGHAVNHKRLKRVMQDANLGLARCIPKLKTSPIRQIIESKRGELNLVHKAVLTPLGAVSTDFTELQYSGGRKAWLMVTIDIVTKVVLGWSVGRSRNRSLALHCWDKTCETLGVLGTSPVDMLVHSDLDAVYTSYDWLCAVLLTSQARLSFSENGAKHNPWVESFWGRLKTEIGSLITEAEDLTDLHNVLAAALDYYTHERRHSALGNLTPAAFLAIQTGMELPTPPKRCQAHNQPEEETIWPF